MAQEIHPACNRPGCCTTSPFDLWLRPSNCPSLRSSLGNLGSFGNIDRFFKPYLDLTEAAKETKVDNEGFQVCVDVQHFQPNEISVKTENNSIVVHAKHEEKQDDHGLISREFSRRYQLPKEYKMEDVVSSLSSDGILTIKASHPTQAVENKVHNIPIQHTGNDDKKTE